MGILDYKEGVTYEGAWRSYGEGQQTIPYPDPDPVPYGTVQGGEDVSNWFSDFFSNIRTNLQTILDFTPFGPATPDLSQMPDLDFNWWDRYTQEASDLREGLGLGDLGLNFDFSGLGVYVLLGAVAIGAILLAKR